MSPLIIALSVFILSTPTSAFNITQILADYPDFTAFNDLLSKTRLNDSINTRQTITVLAVNNGGISSVTGKPLDVAKKILCMHVILDYYDETKLEKLPKGTALLTTLYQTSGAAVAQQGFLNATVFKNGDIAFGSAVKGASLDSKFVKSVVAKPYNISVVEISSPIVPPGFDGAASTPPPSSAAPPPGKSKTKPVSAPAPAPGDDASGADADTPTASPPDSDTPAASPDADVDGPAASPAADVTPSANVDSPAASPDADAADSSSGRAVFALGSAVLVGFVALEVVLL